jgi:hypothetical protein
MNKKTTDALPLTKKFEYQGTQVGLPIKLVPGVVATTSAALDIEIATAKSLGLTLARSTRALILDGKLPEGSTHPYILNEYDFEPKGSGTGEFLTYRGDPIWLEDESHYAKRRAMEKKRANIARFGSPDGPKKPSKSVNQSPQGAEFETVQADTAEVENAIREKALEEVATP